MQHSSTEIEEIFHCGPRQCPTAVIGRIEPAGARGRKKLTLTGAGSARPPKTVLSNTWGKYTDDIIHVTIGEGLSELESNMFAGLRNVRSVYFPRSLNAIFSGAFSECCRLEALHLPDTLRYIGPGAFQGCISLEEVSFGTSTKNIQVDAFRGCKRLSKLFFPSTVAEIGDHAFADTGIEHIQLPDSLEDLPKGCFERCESLQHVAFGEGVSVLSDRAFAACRSLETLDFRPTVNIYHIHDLAFLDCEKVCAVYCREEQVPLLRRHFRPELLVVS